MNERLEADARMVQALRITANPPQSWIDAAVQIPAKLAGPPSPQLTESQTQGSSSAR